MKAFLFTLFICLGSLSGTAQFKFGSLYQSDTGTEITRYFKIYSDGLILMVDTSEDIEEVKKWFNRESEEKDYYVFTRVHSTVKKKIKAVFKLVYDDEKYNCIAQAGINNVSLVKISPEGRKSQTVYTLVEE